MTIIKKETWIVKRLIKISNGFFSRAVGSVVVTSHDIPGNLAIILVNALKKMYEYHADSYKSAVIRSASENLS